MLMAAALSRLLYSPALNTGLSAFDVKETAGWLIGMAPEDVAGCEAGHTGRSDKAMRRGWAGKNRPHVARAGRPL